MPVCPKCRMSFTYAEAHVCGGYDHSKLWWMASVAGGALIGGLVGALVGERLGFLYGFVRPSGRWLWLGALFSLSVVPVDSILGAVIGAIVATVAVIAILARVSSRPKA